MNNTLLFYPYGKDGIENYIEIKKGYSIIDLDSQVNIFGYEYAVDYIMKAEKTIFHTTIPCFLDNKLFWNDKDKCAEIFFISYDNSTLKVIKLKDMTDKEIRYSHNIENMFINGAFDKEADNE